MLLTELPSKLSERKLEAVRNRWQSLGFSTAPADRAAAEAAMRLAYTSAGLKPPAIVIWLGSPRAADTAVRLLKSKIEWPQDLSDYQRTIWEEVWKQSVRQIEAHMGLAGWSAIRMRIKQDAMKAIVDKYGQYFESQAKMIFAEKLSIEAWKYLRKVAGAPVDEKLRGDMEQKAKRLIADQVSNSLSDKLFQLIVPPLRQQIWAPLVEPIRLALTFNNGILDSKVPAWNCGYGLHDADWLAYYDVVEQVGVKGLDILDGLKGLARSCGWWWPMENICIMSERPRAIHRDNRGRLHNEEARAIEYPDRWGLFAWNGILVPEDTILLSEPISFERIEAEPNVTIRRVLIERFGLDNYLRAGKGIKVHSDECGTLYRMNLPGDEPILVVQVVNSTPEPDGTFNEYFLRVPPSMVRARQAVAWTFGLSEDEYYPIKET